MANKEPEQGTESLGKGVQEKQASDIAMLVGVSKRIATIAQQKAKMAKRDVASTPQETLKAMMVITVH